MKPVRYVTQLDVNRSHKLAVLVEVLDAVGNVITELGNPVWKMAPDPTPTEVGLVTGGSVTLDATADARGRFTVEMPAHDRLVPTSPNDLLAPFGNEVRIARGIEFYDRIDLVRLGVFRIDAARVSGDTLTIEGLDRSGWFIDDVFTGEGTIGAGTNKADLIQVVIQTSRTTFTNFMETDEVLPFDVVFHEQESRWGFCQTVAASMGAELFFDRIGTLRLRPIPTEASVPIATIAEGEGGVLLNVERSFDRETVVNRVIVTGQSPYPSVTTIPKGEAIDDNPLSPTYFYGRFGRKPFWYANDFCHTDSACQNTAEGILARSLGAPDSISFGQICDPARSPSDVIRVKRDRLGLGQESHVLDSVEIPLTADGEMACHTRAVDLTAVPAGSDPDHPPRPWPPLVGDSPEGGSWP